MLQYIMPSIMHRSVKSIDDLRVKMAVNQWEKFKKQRDNNQNKNKEEITTLVNIFLEQIGISINAEFNNIVKVKSKEEKIKGRISYTDIKQQSGISCKEDIVWIKFNRSGCISVVGVGCDIYFTSKTKEETSAGKINIFLKQLEADEEHEWDEESILVFPLIGLNKLEGIDRSDIESGIGNYLIANDVPILDYYSHNY